MKKYMSPLCRHFLCIQLARASRRYMQSRTELTTQLAQFKMIQADCSVDSDREIVNTAVERWFGTLDKFDDHVHTSLTRTVLAMIGDKPHFPFKYVWPAFLLRFFFEADLVACGYHSMSAAYYDSWIKVVCGGLVLAIGFPTILPTSLRVASLSLQPFQQKWKNALVTLAMALAIAMYFALIYVLPEQMTFALPVYISPLPLILVLLWFIFLQRGSLSPLLLSGQKWQGTGSTRAAEREGEIGC